MKRVFLLSAFLGLALNLVAAGDVLDLSRIGEGTTWRISNATAEKVDDAGKPAIRLKAAGDSATRVAGLAVLRDSEFTTGTLEIELKGKAVKQRSFLGVAFNIADERTFEAIYFRPFNFKAEPPVNQRAVQYLAWPENTWQKLRQAHPGKFESAVTPTPEPNEWFRARIEVSDKQVRVFVNGAKEPTLTVSRLASGAARPIGLFIDVDDGLFANLRVTPRK